MKHLRKGEKKEEKMKKNKKGTAEMCFYKQINVQ